MRVIFLDIDGVLNHNGTRFSAPTNHEPLPIPVAPGCMAHLNRLIAETGAKIVISSSWRHFAKWQDLGPALGRHGLVGSVIGETPTLIDDTDWLQRWRLRNGGPFTYERLERGWEIREWLIRFRNGVCSCGHADTLHDGEIAECYYNEHPSGASGCLCRQFDGVPLTGFVILDDCSDMAELRPWLVLTDPITGLTDPDVERAKWLLDRSAEGLTTAIMMSLEVCHSDGTTPRSGDS